MSMTLALLALLGATAGAPAAAAPPDLDAGITYESHQALASGVVRDERWQERLVRRGDTVWTERIVTGVSAGARHDHRVGLPAHQHLPSLSPRPQ